MSASEEARWAYPGWQVVAAGGVGVFFATMPLNTFSIFLTPLCDEFGWSREAAASTFGTLTLVAALSAPVIGRLVDHLGARHVVVPSLAIAGVALLSLAFLTRSLEQFRLVYGALGLLIMGTSPIAYSRVIFSWFTALRGRALAVMLAGAGLSNILMPLAAQALIAAAGWRWTLALLGVGTLGIAAPIAAYAVRERDVPRPDPAATGALVRVALRSRVFWTLVVVVFGGTVAMSGALVHLAALLIDRGVSTSLAAVVVSVLGGASLLGRLTTGWFLDRFPPARVSACLLTLAAGGACLLATASSMPAGALAAALIGFGAGGEVDVIPYLLARYFGRAAQSTLYGLTWSAWGLGGALAPAAMGRAFDTTGSYAVALFAVGAITFVAALLILTLPAPPRASAIHDAVEAA